MKLDEVVGIVTGAAMGCGRGFADKILAGGGCVLLTDVNGDFVEATGKEMMAQYGQDKVAWMTQDVVDPDGFLRAFEFAAKHFQRAVNLLVNNAGISGDLQFWHEDTPRTWELVLAINLTAVVRGAQVAVQQFQAQLQGKEGVVINMSSAGGALAPIPYCPQYAAAKAGVVGFTRSCHTLQEQSNIRVLALCPSFVNTAMGALAEMAVPTFLAANGGLMDVSKVANGLVYVLEDSNNGGRVLLITPSETKYVVFPGDDQR